MIKSVLFYSAPLVFAAVVLVTGMVDIVRGLRAKRRLKETLSVNIESDPALKRLAQHASSGLDELELSEATRIISQSLGNMTKDDQRFISRGLDQGNKIDEKRFVSNLMTLL
jgi:hypothetical protein